MNKRPVRKHKRNKNIMTKIKGFCLFIRDLAPKKAYFEGFQIALLGIIVLIALIGTVSKIAPKSLFEDINDQPTTEQLYK